MKVTQLRLAGQGAWPTLSIDRIGPELNVFFGLPRTGKSTVAHLAAHLLYGKTDSPWRRQFGLGTPLVEGSIELDSTCGRYTLRRHRDGTPQGRLSIAAAGGHAVDGRTIRTLLADVSPRLLAQLYAVDFAEPPQAGVLLDGDFAREFTAAIHQESDGVTAVPVLCEQHAATASAKVDRRRVDELVRRRDEVVRQIEQQMSGSRRESAALERELHEVDASLAERRRRAEELQGRLRGVEAALAEIAMRLRYFSLESAVRQSPAIDDEEHRRQIERLDAEIARCRQTLSDLQARDATVRGELAEVHPDGTADSASCLADQRATVGVLERLLDDLDAEVSQLARSHEPGRCVGCDSHARLSPVAEMLRQQLYALCGQVTEQERTIRRVQLHAESRQLARAQTDLSEQLEHLLTRRQSLVHEAQLVHRPVVVLPQAPVARHCQCEHHDQFVRQADAMLLARSDRDRHETDAQRRRTELEREQNELRTAYDSLLREVQSLESRWQRLQRDRAQSAARPTLDALRAELERLETEINRVLISPAPAAISAFVTASHRQAWKASDALAQLTDGQLVQIRVSRDGRAASIIHRDGRALPLAALTAAQQDQAYLALTLALVSSFASRGVDLPLVLDEPFLRQDAAGVSAMAGVMNEFARQGRQVILFTEDRVAARRFESLGVEVRDIDSLRRQPVQPLAAVEPLHAPAAVAPATVVRVVREAIGEPAPQLRLAGEWTDGDEHDVFYLTTDASLADFPVLGHETTAMFERLGLKCVDDLLAADAADVARRLNRPTISASAVRLWQTHTSLMCFVPGVSLNDAQLLAANEVNSPAALCTIDVRMLGEAIQRFLGTERGRRFAASRSLFTRDRLLQLQKLARRERDRWRQASVRYGWTDGGGSAKTQAKLKPLRRARRAASARVAAPVRRVKKCPLRFLLSRNSPVIEAPSISRTAAERLAKVGVRTVADLLNANPESTSAEIGVAKLTAAVITRWQREARLACRIPELRACGARLLVASGFTEPEQVAGANPDELVRLVQGLCRSGNGKRILKNRKTPSRQRIAAWVRHAAQMRPLEAA